HDRGAGLSLGKGDLANSTARSRRQPPNIIRNFCKAYRDGLKHTARFDDCVLGTLRLEMIFGFAEFQPGQLRKVLNRFLRKLRMCIDPCSNRGSTQWQFAECVAQFFKAQDTELGLSSISAEFLPQQDRRRVLQMSPSDLYNVAEFLGLVSESILQFAQSG